MAARKSTTTVSEEVTRPTPVVHGPRREFLTPPVAQIISALIIALAILLHGGIIKIKGVTPKTGTTTTTTAKKPRKSTKKAAAALQEHEGIVSG